MAPKEKAGHNAGSCEFSVQISQRADGFVLTIGHASIWFDSRTAQKILILLGDALAASDAGWFASKDSN
jgi:hypothetical protein